MSLHDIDSDLRTAESTLRHWEKQYPIVAKTEAEASVAFETAWAEAIQLISNRETPEGKRPPTVGVIEAEATTMCAEKLKAKKLAAMDLDVAKKVIALNEAQLSSIQSRAGLLKIEAGLSAYK